MQTPAYSMSGGLAGRVNNILLAADSDDCVRYWWVSYRTLLILVFSVDRLEHWLTSVRRAPSRSRTWGYCSTSPTRRMAWTRSSGHTNGSKTDSPVSPAPYSECYSITRPMYNVLHVCSTEIIREVKKISSCPACHFYNNMPLMSVEF